MPDITPVVELSVSAGVLPSDNSPPGKVDPVTKDQLSLKLGELEKLDEAVSVCVYAAPAIAAGSVNEPLTWLIAMPVTTVTAMVVAGVLVAPSESVTVAVNM